MVRKSVSIGVLLSAGFLILTFGTGLVLMTAVRTNTEDRSKAFGPTGPYDTISPTPKPGSAWDECVLYPNDGSGDCIKTYRQLRQEMRQDWRCRSLAIQYGMCPDIYNIEWPPLDN